MKFVNKTTGKTYEYDYRNLFLETKVLLEFRKRAKEMGLTNSKMMAKLLNETKGK